MPKKKPDTARSQAGSILFVDSSAFVAFLSRRDQNHAQAERIFRDAVQSKGTLLTTNLILAEVHRLLLHRAGIQAAAAALKRIESSSAIRIEFATASHHNSAKARLESLSDYPVSYTDAVSFAVMDSADCTEAITFDQHFRLAGFRAWQ